MDLWFNTNKTKSFDKPEIGKLYKITTPGGIEAYLIGYGAVITDPYTWSGFDNLEVLHAETVFTFLGTFKVKTSIFSKILVGDRIYVTYSPYNKLNDRYVVNI